MRVQGPSCWVLVVVLTAWSTRHAASFVVSDLSTVSHRDITSLLATATSSDELKEQKKKLLGLVGRVPKADTVLADPLTREPITIQTQSTLLGNGGRSSQKIKYQITSPSNTFKGSSDTFINLLKPVEDASTSSSDDESSNTARDVLLRNAIPLIPPPLRSALATAGLNVGVDYVPMRDLFTSPSVSFAYERGWRQGFASAGFPGPDKEAQLANDYFAPVLAMPNSTGVLVDMSCATGLFTRRFAASEKYQRVLGCDYSDSMLTEARRRIVSDASLQNQLRQSNTRLDLVRLDVGQIPMQTASVDVLHAGAAMHCWPDLKAAVSEIYRVLKPGGRYFATTFLSSYFGTLQQAEGGATGPSRQAFQYFGSTDELRDLIISGGFEPEKITIEVLGQACVVIRCEK